LLSALVAPSAVAQERNQIAVIRTTRSGFHPQDSDQALFLVGADDASTTRIYSGSQALLFGGGWAPDGSQLVFVRADGGGLGACHVIVVGSDGSGPHSIRDLAFPDCLFHPSWSPDGATILVQDTLNIFSMWPDGSHYQQVTHFTLRHAYMEGMAWSPDGTHIAFARDTEDGGGRLFVMNADGTDIHKIHGCNLPLCHGEDLSGPAWSPNGRRIAFEEERNILWTGPGGKYMHRVTKCPRTVAFQPCDAISPSWSPNSNRLAYQSGGRPRIVNITSRWTRTLNLKRATIVFWRP